MTLEEAYDMVYDIMCNDKDITKGNYIAMSKAMFALKIRIPKKPNNCGILGKKDKYKFGECPFCRNGVNYEMAYCDRCGQALDWSDDDAEIH